MDSTDGDTGLQSRRGAAPLTHHRFCGTPASSVLHHLLVTKPVWGMQPWALHK